jgi:ABC-type uncharacterized transport system permease subunit
VEGRKPTNLRLLSLAGGLFPVIAVLGALLVGAIMLLILGADPLEGFRSRSAGFSILRRSRSTATSSSPIST